MPEHETFDLDSAFASLERNIAGVSSPRGAGLAVTTARRRRRTTIGAAAAVAVLAVSGVAVAQGMGHGSSSIGPSDGLPAPAPLDGPHLSAATDGWTPAWTVNTEQARLKFAETFGGDCVVTWPGGRGAISVLGNSHDDLALAVMSDYGTQVAEEQRDWRRAEHRLAGCSGAEQVSSFSDPSGAEGETYRIAPTGPETAPQYVWVVNTGHAVGYLKISDQADPLPTANDRPVADALLAALEFPPSFSRAPGSSGGVHRIDPTKTVGQVWAEDFGPALAGWDNPWKPQLTDIAGPEMPSCARVRRR
jgi:hypothetical protein